MDRRELLTLIAAATGCAFIGGAARPDAPTQSIFGPKDIALFDEVGETILPRTDTPGAKDAGIGAFMAAYSQGCYEPGQVAILKAGVGALNAEMTRRYGADFLAATPAQRTEALLEIDREARRYAQTPGHEKDGKAPHYFTLMKQLTLFGFFTSEPGATKVARYRPIPGKYQGVIDYHSGEAFWAWA